MPGSSDLTDIIRQARSGDSDALHQVFDALYQELRAMARHRLRAHSRGTLLDTTSLVHESFLRLAKAGQLQLQDRQHFMCYASQTMRSVVIDFVRECMAERRGGGVAHVTLNTQLGNHEADGAAEILRVNDALEELAQLDARMAQVVEMRYFAGMTEAEIAEALGVTDRTVRRDWEKARLVLAEALK
jgi:RNA polymerase sigma factor (TIGR02999 family)